MDRDSFINISRLKMFMKKLQTLLKKRFDTSNYGIERPLPIGKSKKVVGLMKDELGGKILTEFIELRPKTNCFLKKLKEQTSV